MITRPFFSVKGISLLLAVTLLTGCPEKTPVPPNIILVMVDDMGYSDLGFCGSGIETPHIDRLAADGIVFSSFYNTSRCCPSRAALLTGLYQHQAGVGDMNGDHGFPGYQGFLNDKCLTIAEVLGKHGYRALMTGKWHVGNRPEQWPTRRGFDRFYGIPEGGGVYFAPMAKPRHLVLNDSVIEPGPGFYSTTEFNRQSVNFVKEALDHGQPFFLYLAHIAPHFPLQAPRERYNKYIGQFREDFQVQRAARLKAMQAYGMLPEGMALGTPDERVDDWDVLSDEERELRDLEMAIYAAQLEMVDDGIGALYGLLEKEDQLDNTMILFLSDNGGCHEQANVERRFRDLDGPLGGPGSYRAYSPSWAHVSNTPFRMYKHWVHEGGISSPLIVHYPAKIKKHRVDHSLLHIMDIMPTLLELAGARYPEEGSVLPLEGESFLSLLDDRPGPWRRGPLFWEHEGNRAARMGDWKIVSAWPENRWRLYHMANDRTENHDLSGEEPERVKEMEEAYHAWADRAKVVPWDTLLKRRGL